MLFLHTEQGTDPVLGKGHILFVKVFGLLALFLMTTSIVVEPPGVLECEELIELTDKNEKEKEESKKAKETVKIFVSNAYLFRLTKAFSKISMQADGEPSAGYINIIAPPPDLT